MEDYKEQIYRNVMNMIHNNEIKMKNIEYENIMKDIDKIRSGGDKIIEIIMNPSYYSAMWKSGEPRIFKDTIALNNIKFNLTGAVENYEIFINGVRKI